MDVLIVHDITNIAKPCGNQIETWTVEGASLSCIYIYIYIYKVFRWKNKNYISKKYFDVLSSAVLLTVF